MSTQPPIRTPSAPNPVAPEIALDLLAQVAQPSRYIGGEVNQTTKPWDSVAVQAALVFPDTYEIGISNMGLQILYRLINDRADALAERAYAPWPDYEQALRERALKLTSLESRRPLVDFDLLGIAIPYELTYTNILTVLDLGGLPLLARDRDEQHPLVVGGGAAVYNPEPLADFFDAFVIGDGEEVIHELVDAIKALKQAGASREQQLARLATIPGIYVPALYDVEYHADGRVARITAHAPAPQTVVRRVVADLDAAPYPVNPLPPVGKAVFSRVNVEVTRGCTHGCRFCQAGFTYRPVRERSPERVQELVMKSLENTGLDQVTLASLSTGDYLCLYPMMKDLVDRTQEQKVAFSLPSLRIGTLTPAVVRQIKRVTQTNFTMAPEAGSERLRQVINKPISEGDLLSAVRNVFSEGWREIKFYFMYGLPTEELEDLDGIARLARQAVAEGRKLGGRPRQVRVSTSCYVPKPMTPFQWVGQMPMAELDRRRRYLLDALRGEKHARLTWNDERVARLEAVFSRGDRRLGPALLSAYQNGQRMDAWDELCDLDGWQRVFEQHNIDPAFYAERDIPLDEVLPWDMIDCGTSKAYFASDYARAMRGRIIRDCRYGLCGDCGVCTADDSGRLIVPRVYVPPGGRAAEFDLPISEDTVNHPLVPEVGGQPAGPHRQPADTPLVKYRVAWSKQGAMAFLSHLEVQELILRAVRRAGLSVALSGGYHPRPKLSFGPALSLGVESLCEVLDITLTGYLPVDTLRDRLSDALPQDVEVSQVVLVPPGARSLNLDDLAYSYELRWPEGMPQDLPERIEKLLRQTDIPVQRVSKKGQQRTFDIRPLLQEIWLGDGYLGLFCTSDGNRTARVLEVLTVALGFPPEEAARVRVRRVALAFEEGGLFYSLMDVARAQPFAPVPEESESLCLQNY